MHPGLAALADTPPAAGVFSTLLASGKKLLANRQIVQSQLGRLKILGRTFLNPTAFSKPADRTEWLQRVRANFSHYKKIYALVFIAVLLYTVLSSPWVLIGLGLLAGAWAYCFVLVSPDTPLEIAGFELRRREKLFVLVPFSVFVVAFCGLINSLIYVVFLSGLISLPHASFHEVAELDALDALELEGLQAGVDATADFS